MSVEFDLFLSLPDDRKLSVQESECIRIVLERGKTPNTSELRIDI